MTGKSGVFVDRSIADVFNEMCRKYNQMDGKESIVYVYMMRNPVTNQSMKLTMELK